MTQRTESATADTGLIDQLPGEFFESAPDATLIADPAGIVVHANRRAREMFAGDKVIGSSISRWFVQPGDDGGADAHLPDPAAAGSACCRVQLGSESWHLVVIRDDSSSTAAAKDDIAQAWKKLALGEINNSLAHELNQPLAAVTLHCEAAATTARDAGNADAELIAELEHASAQAFRASDIVSQLRQLFAFEIGSTVAVEPNALVQEAIRMSVAQIGQAGIDCDLAKALPLVDVDQGLFVQVLSRLMGNAIELTGTVKGPIGIATAQRDGEVLFSISRPGLRLDPEAQRFSALKDRQASWAGLEFAICRRVIGAHGGRLEASSHCEGCFCIYLPVTAEEH